MLLGDEKLGILCGNLEEVAHGYQMSTSAVRVLERAEGWTHTAVKMAPLKAWGALVIERGHGDISSKQVIQKHTPGGFPGGAVVKNLPVNAGYTGSSPGPGRSHMLWSS